MKIPCVYFIPNIKFSISCNKYTIPNGLDTKYSIPIKKYANRNTKYANQNNKYNIPIKRIRQPKHQEHQPKTPSTPYVY